MQTHAPKGASPERRHLLTSRFAKLRSSLKQVLGMPDYLRYLEHANRHHPDCRLLTEREFYDQYIAARYGGGTTRCC